MSVKDKLTDARVRSAKVPPGQKLAKLSDGGGLYLIVTEVSKRWQLDYRLNGRRKSMSLGTYPEISLKRARELRDDARSLLAEKRDPVAVRQAERRAALDTFEATAFEWLHKRKRALAPGYVRTIEQRLANDILPYLGKRPVREITAPEILDVLRRIEARGAQESAHRCRIIIGQVIRYGIATGRALGDPTAGLRGALSRPRPRNMAAVTDPRELGGLLRAVWGYEGHPVVRAALRLLPYTFVRPGELRHAEWAEFDFQDAMWRIPAHRMKVKDRGAHLVPLSRQAMDILMELRPLTGHGRLVFPGIRTDARPISDNTLNAAMRRMGIAKDEHTAHGWRATVRTILSEQGWNPIVLERQLAHAEKSEVVAAYHRAEYLPERRRLMQSWADYLDALREGASVVPIHQARR
ncbi:MAG: DUF4102 domain-containing protein [Zetaproteobacteria bacterium]|nr:MAG: DUF4102 domain-containing protein [Zetaproteobacteria bacterium]